TAVSTMPLAMATKKAYACSQPRSRGLPRSRGVRRGGRKAVVTYSILRLRNRKLLQSSESAHTGSWLHGQQWPMMGRAGDREGVSMRVRAVGADALLLEVDEPAAWFAELWRRRATGELTAAEIVPGAA